MSGEKGSVRTSTGTAKLRPVVLLADVNNKQQVQIVSRLDREGLDARFIDSAEHLVNELSRPEVFCVFIHLDFGGGGLPIIKRLAAQTTALWVVLCGNISTQVRSSLHQSGATDTLQLPTNPVQVFLRARMILSKWVQRNDFSETVALPEGYEWKNSAAGAGVSRSSESGAGNDITHVRGGENRSAEPVSFIKGQAPAVDSVSYVRGDASASAKVKVKLESKAALGVTSREGVGAAKPITASANEATRVEQAFRILDSRPVPRPGSVRVASPFESGGLEARKTYAMFYDEVRKHHRDLLPLTSAEKAKVSALFASMNFPLKDPAEFAGVQWALTTLRKFLAAECTRVSADRISIMATRDDLFSRSDDEPLVLHLLVSSDANLPFNDSLSGAAFPQIQLSYRQRKALWLDRTSEPPKPAANLSRPAAWSMTEKSSAVLPILGDHDPAVVLFAQFKRVVTEADMLPLRYLADRLAEHPHAWRVLDFLARLYREIETN